MPTTHLSDAFVVTPPVLFPNLLWLAVALQCGRVHYDLNMLMRKTGFHNRYQIATAQGIVTLSLPLDGGREQKTSIRAVNISPRYDWQATHWRTIVSAYNRSPFFEHYQPELQVFFKQPWTNLSEYALAGTEWLAKRLGLHHLIRFSMEPAYRSIGSGIIDLRDLRPEQLNRVRQGQTARYNQVFEERTGFLPLLSALDLLFMEGPLGGRWLMDHAASIH